MKEKEFLFHLQEMLLEEQLDCALIEANEEVPFDCILIYLGLDGKQRERTLQIVAQEQIFTQDIPEKFKGKAGYYRIQFMAKFPFSYEDKVTHDISSTLLFINRLLELPGLELSEFENQISYRYVLLSNADISKPLLLSIVGNIMLLLDGFGESIEKIATGEATFNNLLEQVIEASKKL